MSRTRTSALPVSEFLRIGWVLFWGFIVLFCVEWNESTECDGTL
jgi:hypothetical protein